MNAPWAYLHKVNGELVKEKISSEYGWTVALMPVRMGQEIKLHNEVETRELIKRYTDGNDTK
jgi:hypothetical protein